jgi:hypothetical protein
MFWRAKTLFGGAITPKKHAITIGERPYIGRETQ